MLIVWLSYMNPNAIIQHLKNIQIGYAVIASVIYICAYGIRSLRWNLLLSPTAKVSVTKTFHYAMAGNFVNYMIPIRIGELVKSYLLKKTDQVSFTRSLSSIFIDKVFDTLGIFFVLLLIPFLHVQISKSLLTLLILLLVVFVLSFLMILFATKGKERISRFIQLFFFWLPSRLKDKLSHAIDLFIDGLGLFKHHLDLIIPAVLLTAVGVILDSLYFQYVFRAIGYTPAFSYVLFGYTLINLSYALPQPPAQLGSNEWMMFVIFSVGFGIDKSLAGAVMAFAHILTAVIMTVMGVIGFAYAGVRSFSFITKGDLEHESDI